MKNFEEFKEKFPEQFKDLRGIECREGWLSLIDKTCSLIQMHLNYIESKNQKIDFYWTQIKSKFAGIRLYHSGGDDYIHGVIDMAESLSYGICEICGEKGKYCKRGNWVDTLCEAHALENEYEIVCQK
jgi:hypothetical protein